MKIAVVTFPGSNCDEDAAHVFRNILRQQVCSVWHRDTELPAGTDLVILPGGFSYGDALRSGAIARFSPVMAAVKAHAGRGGHVLGICNGMQILVESGLIEGAMLQNASRRFVCRTVAIRTVDNRTPFTSRLAVGQTLSMPVAHHEGRWFAPPETVERLSGEGRIVFRYVDNPNGSTGDVAGIVNPRRNVLGMMPHPERASERILGSVDGRAIFESVLEWMETHR